MIDLRSTGDYVLCRAFQWKMKKGLGMRALVQVCWLIALGGCSARVLVGDLGGVDGGNGVDLMPGSAGSGSVRASGGGGGDSGGDIPLLPVGDPEGTTGFAGMNCGGVALDLAPICPETPPENGDSCAGAVENSICTWQVTTGSAADSENFYVAAGCYTWLNGKVWWTSAPRVGYASSEDGQVCPLAAPLEGSSCTGLGRVSCSYPFSFCECNGIDAAKDQWACGTQLPPAAAPPPPRPVKRNCSPPDFDERIQVKDLSSLEAINWCTWSLAAVPRAGRSPWFVGSAQPFQSNGPATPLCMASMTLANCVKNLRSRPCTATLEQIDDCVANLALGNPDGPPSYWVGHGCGPLLENPTCSGVVVQPWLLDEADQARQCVAQLQ